jgi:hypothetical protein
MKREVDQRKTRKALRKLRRAADRATEAGGPGLTDWEQEFVEGVTTRLEKYGSAFRDPGKGRLEEALSARQAHITRVIDKKSRKAKPAAAGATPANQPGEPVRTSQQRASAPATKSGDKPKPRSSFKPKAKPGWKPRGRDINDEPAHVDSAAPKRASLKVIPGGKPR